MSSFLIRTDINETIGSGHFMRCRSIACAMQKLGCDVIFAVTDTGSLKAVQEAGFEGFILGGSFIEYTNHDGILLAKLAEHIGAYNILVDSYAVNKSFFDAVNSRRQFKIAYVDDLYTYKDGLKQTPSRYEVDAVINYGFSFEKKDYRAVYPNAYTNVLIGPSYAPIRSSFVGREYEVSSQVSRILLTTGSTNPNKTLERMIGICERTLANCVIEVVVGRNCQLSDDLKNDNRIILHNGVDDLSDLMCAADLVISAGGTTLYELSCIGVPTIALPVVENQIENVTGFLRHGLGLAYLDTNWADEDLSSLLKYMAKDVAKRRAFSQQMRKTVDGFGALRIATHLLGRASFKWEK